MKNSAWGAIVVGAGLLAAAPVIAADRCSASSAAQRVAVVELYTSEGCSSCPPADRWLSTLMGDAKAGRVLPLAFHVDYWDYIGWKDPYAQAAFSRRQRELAARGGARTIYTPQVVVDARDFPGWRSRAALESSLAAAARRPAGVDLSLDLRSESQSSWRIGWRGKLSAGAGEQDAMVFLAVYENNLETRVRAGENAGATLRHDYVVRDWLGPFRIAAASAVAMHADVAIRPDWKRHDLGVAAVAYSSSSGEVLQALSLPACMASAN